MRNLQLRLYYRRPHRSKYVALESCKHSLIYAVCRPHDSNLIAVDAYQFRTLGNCEQGEYYPWLFCRRPNCNSCYQSEESTTIHTDCYNLYTGGFGNLRTLHRLWVAGSWKQPWRNAPISHLDPEPDPRGVRDEAAKRFDMPLLKSLPPELWQMILDYAHTTTLNRLCSTQDLLKFFRNSKTESSKAIHVPLGEVFAWQRGDTSPQVGSCGFNSSIRLTFDARGLRRIERLEQGAVIRHAQLPNLGFVVEQAHRFLKVVASFQVWPLF